MDNIRIFVFYILFLCTLPIGAQEGVYGDYEEPVDSVSIDENEWNFLPDKVLLSWASRDVHYKNMKALTLLS